MDETSQSDENSENVNTEVEPTIAPTSQELPDTTPAEPAKKPSKKKETLIVFAIGLLVILLGVVGFMLVQKRIEKVDDSSVVIPAITLLGANTTLVDGTAQFSADKAAWQDLKGGETLSESMYIRTMAESRVIITLDDGSAIRLNANSLVQLTSLHPKNIKISQEAGEVYVRVVPSDRSFSVDSSGESYKALGTAFKTIASDSEKGVEVYQSSVKAEKAGQEVGEGKRFFSSSASEDKKGKVTDIPLDQIGTDAFVLWNLDRDKEASEFKDKLGYLNAYEESKNKAPAPTPKPVVGASAGIKLSGNTVDGGVKFSWTVSGVSTSSGFKLVKSKDSTTPTYGKDSGVYIDGSTTRSYTWGIKDGNTYYFRICAYRPDQGSCDSYSNAIQVATPSKPASETITPGPLSLSINSGTASWSVGGTAPHGFKLVMSTSSGPTYPGNSKKYVSPGETSTSLPSVDPGTWYVRVCKYTGDGCTDYSNEVAISIP